jgi:hypothetical protein
MSATPADAAASAVACRGYMWANQHPAPSKWRPLRAPLSSVVARATACNRAELTARVTKARAEIEPAAQSSVQILPYARVLVAHMPGHPVQVLLPMRWQKLWHGTVQEEYGGGVEAPQPQTSVEAATVAAPEDEIED